jgi:hypothetical protein
VRAPRRQQSARMKKSTTKPEGNYKDRRMAYFADENDIKAKRTSLEKALEDLISLQNK